MLFVSAELVPFHFGIEQHFRGDEVAAQRVVFGDRHIVVGDKGWRVVLRAVDHPGLHAAVNLADAHRHRVRPHRFQRGQRHRAALHADFLPFQIVRFDDRLFGDQVTGAGIHPAEEDQARFRVGGQLVANLLADIPVDHLVHVVFIAEYVGQRKHFDIRQDGGNRRHRDADHVYRPHLRLLNHLLFIPQHAAGEDLNLQLAIGLLFEFFTHLLNRHHVRVAFRMHIGGFDGLGRNGAGKSRQAQSSQ